MFIILIKIFAININFSMLIAQILSDPGFYFEFYSFELLIVQ
jgi:hypothetical protein